MGPLSMPTLAKSRFILVFTDNYSRISWVYFLKSKDQTFLFFRTFIAKIQTKTSNHLGILHIDQGGEYLSHKFTNFCNEQGIQRQLIQPHNLQQNEILDRCNRTIIN